MNRRHFWDVLFVAVTCTIVGLLIAFAHIAGEVRDAYAAYEKAYGHKYGERVVIEEPRVCSKEGRAAR